MTTLRAHARNARARFIDRRTPVRALPLAISRRRLFILPTRSGVLFALLLVVMLLGATNYQNSLAFALTFWLGAIALVSMHHAHANLLGVQISQVSGAPVFAGEIVHFEITLAHVTGRARRALRLSADGQAPGERVDIEPGETQTVRLSCTADRRGRLACPRLCIQSVYPIGLFRAWSWLQPDVRTLVYPRSAGHDRLPTSRGDAQAAEQVGAGGHADFIGHRPYLHGDSLRRMDWKASARSDDLRVREYAEPRRHTLWLDESAAGSGDRETRLSQLTCWVLQADRAGQVYGLRVGNRRLGPDSGPGHRLACLRALALA